MKSETMNIDIDTEAAEQRAEAKGYSDRIASHGTTAQAALAKLRKEVAALSPSEAIDALSDLDRTWSEIAAQAGEPQ